VPPSLEVNPAEIASLHTNHRDEEKRKVNLNNVALCKLVDADKTLKSKREKAVEIQIKSDYININGFCTWYAVEIDGTSGFIGKIAASVPTDRVITKCDVEGRQFSDAEIDIIDAEIAAYNAVPRPIVWASDRA